MGNIFSIQVSSDAVVNHLWDCMAGKAMYMCKLEENLDDLRNALQELRELRDGVMTRVNIDEQRQLQRLAKVQGWLSRVATMETEVDELITAAPQVTQKLCLGGCCSKNCISSYKFGKLVANKLGDVEVLKSKGDFDVVTERVPAPPVDERPSESTVGLGPTLDKAWSCLLEERVGIFGLYGMGGVGKTTLLTKINNKFLTTPNDFNVVIWVLVSRDLQLEKIQEDIGKKLGLIDVQWQNKGLQEKAIDIHRVLRKKKFVLLLNDIWERVDLVQVGVPLPNNQNGSPTRSEEVCGSMEADDGMEVKCLTWNDAWDLFQNKVGQKTLCIHQDIPELAKLVAKRCCGLPLALITTGRAMARKKTPQEWRHAIDVLKKSASEFSGMGDKMFPLLKFSYDNLKSQKVRSCFLYCALFPEDFKIKKDELIDYWIGEGILDGYDDRIGAENRGYDFIGTLIQACLLVEVEDNCVRMHDVLRDMALWIACMCEKEKEYFFVEAGSRLTEAPKVEKLERVRRMSLMVNRIENLTETPRCPCLLAMFLGQNSFELPVGISKLFSLQYLNLSRTGIRELPIEFKNLVKLKYLNLENTTFLKKIPLQVISSLLDLQVLKVLRCGSFSEALEDNILSGGNELLIEELQGLEHLNVLTISIKSAFALQLFLSSPKLQNCTIALSLDTNGDSHFPDISFLANMKHLSSFNMWLYDVLVVQSPSNLHKSVIQRERYFDNLYRVEIDFCSGLRDLTWLIFAPNLSHLSVSRMGKMKEIISERKLDEVVEEAENLIPFGRLEVLPLIHLDELKSIYWSPLPFPFLRIINVFNCPKLKKLPLNSDSAKDRKIVIEGEEHWRKELEWEDQLTESAFLPHCRSDRYNYYEDDW